MFLAAAQRLSRSQRRMLASLIYQYDMPRCSLRSSLHFIPQNEFFEDITN